jgi:hypothetical protein
MSGGVVTRNLNRILAREGLDKNFRDSYIEAPFVYNRFLKTGKSDKPEVQMATVVGPNRFYRSGDREVPTLSTVEAGRKAAAVDRQYTAGYVVSKMAQEDDMYGKVDKGAYHLGRAWRLTREYIGASLLDDAFAGSVFTGQDGLSLINASHTLMRSTSTVSNGVTGSGAVGFSIAGVTQLMQLAQRMVDQNGDPIEIDLDTCILPNTEGIIQDAWKIFGMAKEPFTANNDDNAIKGRLGNINWFVNKYMTSQSRYFMIDSKHNDAHHLDYVPMALRDYIDPRTLDFEVYGRARILQYFYDFRGWFGQNPS